MKYYIYYVQKTNKFKVVPYHRPHSSILPRGVVYVGEL